MLPIDIETPVTYQDEVGEGVAQCPPAVVFPMEFRPEDRAVVEASSAFFELDAELPGAQLAKCSVDHAAPDDSKLMAGDHRLHRPVKSGLPLPERQDCLADHMFGWEDPQERPRRRPEGPPEAHQPLMRIQRRCCRREFGLSGFGFRFWASPTGSLGCWNQGINKAASCPTYHYLRAH